MLKKEMVKSWLVSLMVCWSVGVGAQGSVVKPLECKKISKAVKIDGDLNEWKNRPSIKLGKENIYPVELKTFWKGENDLSFEGWMAWDENNFYFACCVKDDTHVNAQSDSLIWNADCLQVGFDALNDAKIGDGYQSDDYEYGFALTNKGLQMWRWYGGGTLSSIKYAVTRVKNNTIYEISFPANSVAPLKLEEGKVFGFNFTVNESDKDVREYFMQLTPGLGEKKDLGLWQDVVLVK